MSDDDLHALAARYGWSVFDTGRCWTAEEPRQRARLRVTWDRTVRSTVYVHETDERGVRTLAVTARGTELDRVAQVVAWWFAHVRGDRTPATIPAGCRCVRCGQDTIDPLWACDQCLDERDADKDEDAPTPCGCECYWRRDRDCGQHATGISKLPGTGRKRDRADKP